MPRTQARCGCRRPREPSGPTAQVPQCSRVTLALCVSVSLGSTTPQGTLGLDCSSLRRCWHFPRCKPRPHPKALLKPSVPVAVDPLAFSASRPCHDGEGGSSVSGFSVLRPLTCFSCLVTLAGSSQDSKKPHCSRSARRIHHWLRCPWGVLEGPCGVS